MDRSFAQITIAHGKHLPQSIIEILTKSDCILVCLDEEWLHEIEKPPFTIIILDASCKKLSIELSSSKALKVCEYGSGIDADIYVPSGFPTKETLRCIQFAIEQYQLKVQARNLQNTLEVDQYRLRQLTEIGIALAQEKNLGRLLKKILDESQTLSNCDAVSLFLVDKKGEDEPRLVFKLAQNTSIPNLNFEEKSFPLNNKSIAGYCAMNREIVNIRNAYQIIDEPYSFDPTFDKMMNYRTISILAIPITNNEKEVIGVLQFINRKMNYNTILSTQEIACNNVISFDASIETILFALAGQAGVAIENSLLLDNINNLLDGFVHASVMAIEQRDPTTSGHSFRVADLTCGLAESLHRSNLNSYNRIIYTEKELREIRFASLLHDFGKVGVREHVLVKPKKLTTARLDIIQYRFELEKSRLQREVQEKIISSIHHGYDEKQIAKLKQKLAEDIAYLDEMFECILNSNEPSILPDGDFEHLQQILKMPFTNKTGNIETIISQQDFLALSVRKGSLTEEERLEIQSHVVHSYNFLKQIPWTRELKKVPDFAHAHHEKLNGSGYPRNLKADEIPFPSKMMAICDIFDALVAKDRPYKKALPLEIALRIINSEAEEGYLDKQLVDIFMHAKVYDITQREDYSIDIERNVLMKERSICDVNLK